MFVLFVNLVILSKIKNLQNIINRILVVDSAYVPFIKDTGIPLFPCGFIFKFPVMKSPEDLAHLKPESLKFLGIGSTDFLFTFFFFLQTDPLILFVPGLFTLGVNVQPEIIDQFECGLLCIKVKHLLNEIDHVPIGSAPEAVKPLINLHAGMLVVMKRTA